MNKDEVKNNIKEALKNNSEGELVEFKDGRGGFPKSSWSSISAFGHNPEGGILVFGVVDEGQRFKVVGLENISKLQEQFTDLINNNMSFKLRPSCYSISIEGKNIFVAYIPECPKENKPYYYKPKGLPEGARIRVGNTDREMKDREIRELYKNSVKKRYDRKRASGVSLDEISKEKILFLLNKTGNRTERDISIDSIGFELMENLGILGKFGEVKAPTVAGYLIFGKQNPQLKQNFSRYIIRCVRYKGINKASDIIDSRDIEGTLDEQIDQTQKFILRNIKKSAQIEEEGTKRIEKYEYPPKAIREIVANAVIHRDYEITETYTQVSIFDNRIEIFSPGRLPPGVTVENIKDSQLSRNPIIAERLKDLDYLEEYGRGIDIVFRKMEEWSLINPIFKNKINGFKVILPGKNLSNLNGRQIKIMDYLLENNDVDMSTLKDIFPDVTKSTLNRDLKELKENNIINQKGESTNIYYKINF